MDASFLGKVDLSPTAIRPQLPNPLSESNADVPCHSLYGGVSLEDTSTLSCGSGQILRYSQIAESALNGSFLL